MSKTTTATITAREAAAILGVSPATLYSYVSRGLLASSSGSGVRAKRYAHDDVLRLAARRGDGKRAGHAVSAAMNWGVPVLETRIAQIADGRLYYRGHDACALAEQATLEQAAALLWQADQGNASRGNCDAPLAHAAALPLAPLPRAMALLPLVDAHASPIALLRVTAAMLLGTRASDAPLHRQAADAWGAGMAADVLRSAMVVLADHELNNSAFTVRCAASSGAALPLVLCAGLAALSGPEHGGHYALAKAALLREAAAPGTVQIEPMTAGFGHPLYADGDIRATYLLDKLHAYDSKACAPFRALAARAGAIPQAQPNSDFALAALELVLRLPDGAALALLAMARTAGWIAHALEQRADGRLIRPRARYVGAFNTAGAD
ncbi:citrate synthase family protein [Pseudoduganella ginsengisoli]|uniref:Helix-turn-helix domain-containing protein n=1 Tax=Pseudoduganella ginsengisoli TaxID=1462440 RepID=A0A6L6PY38_9BURK|nr:citrate synthase family protein [Pseudoduganella ginsengisoli]MTW02099.1 helix-turn-helix domain-containing protein [Pseudoduganella ginsengisoli]